MIYAIVYQVCLVLVSFSIIGLGVHGAILTKTPQKKVIFGYSIVSGVLMLIYAIDPLVEWYILSVNELLLLKFLGLFMGILPFEQVSISLIKMGSSMMGTQVPEWYQIMIYILTFIRGSSTVVNYTSMILIRSYIPMVILVWVYLTSALIIIISMMFQIRKIKTFLKNHRMKISRGSSRFNSLNSASPINSMVKVTIINPYQESVDMVGKTIAKLSLLAMFLGLLIVSGTIYFLFEIISVVQHAPHTEVGSYDDTSYPAPYYYIVGMFVVTILNAIPLSYNYKAV